MPKLPSDVQTGAPFRPVASEQNEVNRLLRQLKNISVSQGIDLDRSTAGLAFSLNRGFVQALIDGSATLTGIGGSFGAGILPGIGNFSPPVNAFWLTEKFGNTVSITSGVLTFYLWVKDSENGLRSHSFPATGNTPGVSHINMGVKVLSGDGDNWGNLSDAFSSIPSWREQEHRSFHAQGSPDNNDSAHSILVGNTSGRTIAAGVSGASFLEDTGGGNPEWIQPGGGSFIGQTIHIRSGTGANQTRVVTSTTATRANITPDWDVIPAPGSTYEMVMTGPGLKGVALPVSFTGRSIVFEDGSAADNIENIDLKAGFYFNIELNDVDPVGTTLFIGQKGAVFSNELDIQDKGIQTEIETGTSDGTTNIAKLVNTTENWTDGEHVGRQIQITSGGGAGQIRLIEETSDAFDTIRWAGANITGLTAGATYRIFEFEYPNTIKYGDDVIGEL